MSLKGAGKAFVRAPQTFKQRFNIGESTKDAVYIDAERRFQELEHETKKLHDESKKYFDAINGIMNHQIEFSRAIQEIYQPISGRMSDPDATEDEGNEAGIEACAHYEALVKDLQETLSPELEMIETRVIAPADELLTIIKAVRKTTLKRQHKQLDYDRHAAAYKKLKEKKDKTLKDEKALYKAEADLEQSTADFEYFNDLLKDELPKLFKLEREFILPLFQSFYYMQLNVFYTLHEKMQAIDIGYFNFNLEIEEAFEQKRGDIQDQTEQLTIVHFKKTGGKRPGGLSKYQSKYAIEGGSRYGAIEAAPKSAPATSTALTRRHSNDSMTTPPPPYPGHSTRLSPGSADLGRANSVGNKAADAWEAVAKAKGAAPPPPKPKPARLSGAPAIHATALYDFEAEADGDLSFKVGDVIEITKKGATENEWWTGKLHGQQGQFPGKDRCWDVC
jgi:amphiphysin